MSTHDRMLERIRRLLAKAEASASEAERDAYNSKAAALIARYGIEEALLAAKETVRQLPGDRIVELDPPYARDKGSLLAAVAAPLAVRVVLRQRRRQGTAAASALSMHLFGMPSDLKRVDMLYTSLLVQAAHGLAGARPAAPYESVAAYRRSWMIGFAATVQQRLTAAEAAAKARADSQQTDAGRRGPSVSLVLADRAALVDQVLAESYPKLRMARGRMLSGSGSAAGAAAARRADLGGHRLDHKGRPALQ